MSQPAGIIILLSQECRFVANRWRCPLAERGRIKWFNENRGYGFIRPDTGGADIYVHYSDLEGEGFRTLSEGEIVEFDIGNGSRGMQARNVRRIAT